ncbi:hypothetical protein ACFSIL_46525 [Streptosporangium lutulentum]
MLYMGRRSVCGTGAPIGHVPNSAGEASSFPGRASPIFPSQGDSLGVVKALGRILAEACQGEERQKMIVFSEEKRGDGAGRMADSGGDPVDPNPSETLFCKDFDYRSQPLLVGACLDLAVT